MISSLVWVRLLAVGCARTYSTIRLQLTGRDAAEESGLCPQSWTCWKLQKRPGPAFILASQTRTGTAWSTARF